MFNNFNQKFKKITAFTLAEVLIVIAIIGVIAQITIPTLMQNVQEKVAATSLKKAYSTLANAYTLAVQENGTPDNWNLASVVSPTGAENIINNLEPYLKLSKKCGGYGDKGCFPDANYRTLDGRTTGEVNYTFAGFTTSWSLAQLNDGSSIAAYTYTNCDNNYGITPALQHVCGLFVYDINGYKKPNQDGIDFFWFWLTKSGIIPFGTDGVTKYPFSTQCSDKNSTTALNGRGCAAWVIYNENMDYLKCTGLSWSGPTKCN